MKDLKPYLHVVCYTERKPTVYLSDYRAFAKDFIFTNLDKAWEYACDLADKHVIPAYLTGRDGRSKAIYRPLAIRERMGYVD